MHWMSVVRKEETDALCWFIYVKLSYLHCSDFAFFLLIMF